MKNYPDLLRHIHQPPKKIYSLGDSSILGGNLIAFVGTRNFTPYGKMMTERLIEDLALCKIVIVSGLARGIDTIAHEAALRVGLKTVAVLGTGIGNIYPEENCELADRIIADGGCTAPCVCKQNHGSYPLFWICQTGQTSKISPCCH